MPATSKPPHPRDDAVSPLRLLSAYLTTDHPAKPPSPRTPLVPNSLCGPTTTTNPVECHSHRIKALKTQLIGNLEFALALGKDEKLSIVTTGNKRAIVVALGYAELTGGCERWMAIMEVEGVDSVDGWEEALGRSEEAVREKLGELVQMVPIQSKDEDRITAEQSNETSG